MSTGGSPLRSRQRAEAARFRLDDGPRIARCKAYSRHRTPGYKPGATRPQQAESSAIRLCHAGTERALCQRRGNGMRGTVLLGVILLIAGLAGLAWPVITYTKTEKVVDIGPVEVTAEREKHVPVPPIVGGLAAVAGVVIIVAGSRKP